MSADGRTEFDVEAGVEELLLNGGEGGVEVLEDGGADEKVKKLELGGADGCEERFRSETIESSEPDALVDTNVKFVEVFKRENVVRDEE